MIAKYSEAGFMIEILPADKITKEHIAQALALDRISYDEMYDLDLETCEAYFRKNPLIYIMLTDNAAKTMIGYINFSPVTEAAYSLILSGQVIDTLIRENDIVEYSDNLPCWGYLSSAVVHPDYRHKGYAKMMISKLSDLLCELAEERGIFFKGIVADAVSDAGYRLLDHMGFEQVKSSAHDTRIMCFNPFSDSVRKTDFNKRVLSVYSREESNRFQV